MYLSRIRLQNWRSYEDVTFAFKKPTKRQPLYLIGAMNGHGKTSLLVSLYLGLFGRFGLRHCEGFSDSAPEDFEHYTKTLPRFRRDVANADEPTEIELTFTPTLSDSGESEIRVIRRWHFGSSGRLRGGDSSETVEIYDRGNPVRNDGDILLSHDKIERLLFPAYIAPAFFFDGEQAQTLINTAGTHGLKKSVEVMFGTRVVDEVRDQIRDYIRTAHGRMGGKRKAGEKEKLLREKEQLREKVNDRIALLEKKGNEFATEKEGIERLRKETREQLARIGGDRASDVELLHSELVKARQEKQDSEAEIKKCVQNMGLALALSRLHVSIENRFQAEDARERWENIKSGTLERADKVLEVAMPEPAPNDQLLGHLAEHIREKVKDRFRLALAQIYNPPPKDCADSYLFGHVSGEARAQTLELLHDALREGAADVKKKIKRLQDADFRFDDAKTRFDREKDTPANVDELKGQLEEYDSQIDEAIRALGDIESETRTLKSELHDLNVTIKKLRDEIASMEPEQKRVAIAERVSIVTGELTDKLRPVALKRLQELVTSHFTTIADPRYRGGRIAFPEDDQASPVFVYRDGREQMISSMSGFERRTFGVAFSLALAEMTRRRVPLVIDTPLGNADSEYRPRLMEALTKVDLDQVIILTHDQEVNGELLGTIEKHVAQKFLVEYDGKLGHSVVHEDMYFGAKR